MVSIFIYSDVKNYSDIKPSPWSSVLAGYSCRADASVVRDRTQYQAMFKKIRSVDAYLNSRQQKERAMHGRTHSDDEEEDVYEAASMDLREAEGASLEVHRTPKTKSFFSKLRKVMVRLVQ